jgi:hypothetical protein
VTPLGLVSPNFCPKSCSRSRCYSNLTSGDLASPSAKDSDFACLTKSSPGQRGRGKAGMSSPPWSTEVEEDLDITERDKALKPPEKVPRTPIRCSLDCRHYCPQNIETKRQMRPMARSNSFRQSNPQYIISIATDSHNAISTLTTNLFPSPHLQHSKKAQITLRINSSSLISPTNRQNKF